MRVHCDILVLGSGIAGLSFALRIPKDKKVFVLSKGSSNEGATAWAQGGIAAVLSPDDSFEAHLSDTLNTGGGLSHKDIAELVVREAPGHIQALQALGAQFTQQSTTQQSTTQQSRDESDHQSLDPAQQSLHLTQQSLHLTNQSLHLTNQSLHLTQEGGHSARRVVHADDFTGQEVLRVLLEAAVAAPNIEFFPGCMAIDLIESSRFGGPRRVVGAYVLDESSGEVSTYLARATILATGGSGKVYRYTSNPDVATGDGLAMAYRAGAHIANMEFFQFHPTCLYHTAFKNFLISEALRGEGGVLCLPNGEAFMKRHDSRGDLAPRDVVARAIDYEMKRTGAKHVYLDMTHCAESFLEARFPNICRVCRSLGIDLVREPIPVVPAAHYQCGGVSTDGRGKTSIPGLFAIGEVAHTGLHGANRLASNSLLEGLVFGARAAEACARTPELSVQESAVPDWDAGSAAASDEAVIVTHNWAELRRFMWNYVGIVRTNKRLRRAARRVALLQEEIREYYWQHLVNRDLLELRNIADVAELIISCASYRRESRGLHYNLDFPELRDEFEQDTVIVRGGLPFSNPIPPGK